MTSSSVYYKKLLQDLKQSQLDRIRFAAYRTAMKLRFIQRRVSLHLVDLYALIECFRLSHFHVLEFDAELSPEQLEQLLCTLYDQLNKRLGLANSAEVAGAHENYLQELAGMLHAWLFARSQFGFNQRMTALGAKVALSVLCNAKPIDKLRYHFTLLCDPVTGVLDRVKAQAYTIELLSLPAGVFEQNNFYYQPETCCFLSQCAGLLNFLEILLAEDAAPQALLWLTTFHRLQTTASHPVKCSVCGQEPILGFRYKCQQCVGAFNLCQECFWTGATAAGHTLNHEVKEYTSWKQPGKQSSLASTLRRGLHAGAATSSTTSPHHQHHQQQQQQHPGRARHFSGQLTAVSLERSASVRTAGIVGVRGGGGVGAGQMMPMGGGFIGGTTAAALLDPPDNGPMLDLTHIVPPPPPPSGLVTHSLANTGGSLGRPGKLTQLPHSLQQLDSSAVAATAAAAISSMAPTVTAFNDGFQQQQQQQQQQQLGLNSWAPTTSMSNSAMTFTTNATTYLAPGQHQQRMDDEHKLIARYAAALQLNGASGAASQPVGAIGGGGSGNAAADLAQARAQERKIRDLERQNERMLAEIEQLKLQSAQLREQQSHSQDQLIINQNSLLGELRHLRQRKDQLEERMGRLQESRRDLMQQLEQLMARLSMSDSYYRAQAYGAASRSVPSALPHQAQLVQYQQHPYYAQQQQQQQLTQYQHPYHSLQIMHSQHPQQHQHPQQDPVRHLFSTADDVSTAIGGLVEELQQLQYSAED